MKREIYIERYIKSILRETRLGRYYRAKKKLKTGMFFSGDRTIDDMFPEVLNLKIINEINIYPKIGIHADHTEYERFGNLGSYYLRYKRFLDYNNIPYTTVDVSQSDWLEQTRNLDILVVSYRSGPSRLNELQAKTCILENKHGVVCYPSCKDMWSYEDKTRIFYLIKEYGFEHVDTFISHNKEESFSYVENAQYPFVSKIKTGSGSRGVELVKNKKRAKQIVRQNFGLGRRALWTYSFEKDYVYFQKFIEGADYDLRIFVVGDIIAGYKRRMRGDDFRASGAGILDRSLFPEDAISIAMRLKEKWDTTILAVDFVYCDKSKKHKIIEASISFGLDYPEYLEIEGRRVYYTKTKESIELRDGCFWVQEFILFELIKKWFENRDSSVQLGWELINNVRQKTVRAKKPGQPA